MKLNHFFAAVAAAMAFCGSVSAQDTFTVKVVQPEHGRVTVTPAVPEDGVVKAGTVLDVKVEVTDPDWVFDSGYWLSIDKGMFYPVYKESMVPEFKVTVNNNIMGLGASIMEKSRLDGYSVIQDVVYAQPGVKPLKYDVFTPDGARNLPCIVIIHGGGWSSNTEDIMRGLARELIKGGKYVVCSIDYRWIATSTATRLPTPCPTLSRTASEPCSTSRSMLPSTAPIPTGSRLPATARADTFQPAWAPSSRGSVTAASA